MNPQLRFSFDFQPISCNSKLQHRFRASCVDLRSLLDGCYSIDDFCKRLVKQSEDIAAQKISRMAKLKLSKEEQVELIESFESEKYVYRGDGLEYFTEALIKLMGTHPHIGISEYTTKVGPDIGVDGVGIGANGYPATVQVKFRSNKMKRLTANDDHLTNFLGASQNVYGVRIDDKKNMIIVTTAPGLNFFTDEKMLHNKVRCLGINELAKLVDNNGAFWDSFRQLSDAYYV
jgi:hypothetical protein